MAAPTYKAIHGDCLVLMQEAIERGTLVDAIVCDPPYHLSTVKRFGKPGSAPPKSDGATGVYKRAAKGFMGKQWDGGDIAFDPATWKLAFDLLKPGGHLIAFGGSRTYHRMTCAIEDAGFEIRDQLMWLYGTGFPKSHNVAKSIDKAGGASVKEQSQLLRVKREAAGMTRDELAKTVGCTVSSIRDWEEGRARTKGGALEWIIPSEEYRVVLANLLEYSKDERKIIGVATVRTGDGTVLGLGHEGTIRTGGHTDLSAEWEGWGTALKPAHEPIVWACKPLTVVPLSLTMRDTEDLIGVVLCQLLKNANSAELVLASSRLVQGGGMSVSALLIAAVLHGESLEGWCAEMVTCNSPEAVSTCLSIARSWRTISEGVLIHGNTFTTSMETELTTALRTLKSLVLEIMPGTITQAVSSLAGRSSGVQGAEKDSSGGSRKSPLTQKHTADDFASLRQTLTSVSVAEAAFTGAGLVVNSVLRSVTTSLEERLPPDIRPAHEPIVLARKPLEGTVASNVMKHGVGAINIDATRVEANGEKTGSNGAVGLLPERGWNQNNMSRDVSREQSTTQGRWPANVVLSWSEDEYILREDITDAQKDELYRWMRENT